MRYMTMRFSTRTAWETTETELARALQERKRSGLPLFDLTASNPTRCGFAYDAESILAPLCVPGALDYEPDPRGMLAARSAVCRYYRDHEAMVGPEQVFLTTSTSEAYSFVFRLLCDPGDEILIAQPSYPLFDFLASLDHVRLVPYPLFYDHGWHLDLEGLRRGVTPRTRAIVVVHPNNPTGHFTKLHERKALEELCSVHGLALIVDEVFLDYPLTEVSVQSFAAGSHSVLTFVLSGMSKIAGLPQMKAAWIAAFGPEAELTQALSRLEVIADTFLSMNAPVQCALPVWIEHRQNIQQQIFKRTAANLQTLDALLSAQSMVDRLHAEGGWYAVLRIPALREGEDLAVELVREHGVSLHPGSFFGFPGNGHLVVSLLPEEKEFRSGIERVLDVVRLV